MNNTITIDTHLHAKNLKRVGFSDEQVDAQLALAQAQTDFINNNLATKTDIFLIQRDIKQIESNLKRDIEDSRLASKNDIALIQKDIAELRKETKQDIALLSKVVEERTKALIWIGGVIAFIVGSSQVLKLLGF